MDTSGQSQTPNIPQAVLLSTYVVLLLAGASAALYGTAEQSERGFRLLNWLYRFKTEASPTESDL
ncbi:hypothetical protein [Streptomyces sp. NPDC090445]|uniref:hypothetical protein n=1 Tax=Streptomyces sp. NPDC090445 TaxID=3365963 RepID=UPI00381BEA2D